MLLIFSQALDEIARLVKYFQTNRATFLAPTYKEAQARQFLIDPLFAALGWEVHPKESVAPDYAYVVVEPTVSEGGRQRAPDYIFQFGRRDPKFFVEAKKPGVALKTNSDASHQLRSYGWNANLPLCILTDFEEFAIYNCLVKPRASDKPSKARINYYICAQYADQWRDIWDIFSFEAVRGGSFDQFKDSAGSARASATVDADFLETIEGWRKSLAQNIELRNQLRAEDLTDAVQRTIDRLIFLRIAEDRDIEKYEQLKELSEGEGVYLRLVKLFKQADAKYNSGLFDFARDKRTPTLDMDDRVLKTIIADLYGDYNFKIMPVQVLGNVYEQFLGKVISVTTGGHAKVEEKPAVRKAGGVYYTPAYIVDYIVRHTVGQWVEGKTPKEVARLRVLDMACGSGSFLLGAYQFLLDWHLQWYVAHEPHKQKAVYDATHGTSAAQWHLTTDEKGRILLNNIYGVDIDKQAVEVTKLSLLLKVLEDESAQTLQPQLIAHDGERERALPNLDQNIKPGNSLIGSDYFAEQMLPDADELRRVNPFDWRREFRDVMKTGGFDCVIGNPPYGATLTETESQYLRTTYEATNKELDTYSLFMEKAIQLCRSSGKVGMIVPTGWYSGVKFSTLRRYVACITDPECFINLPYDVFEAWVDTTVFIVSKRSERLEWPRTVPCVVRLRTFPKRHRIASAAEFDEDAQTADMIAWFSNGDDDYLTYADSAKTELMQKIETSSKFLKEFADVQRGVTPFALIDKPLHPNSRIAFAGTVRRYKIETGPIKYIRFDESLAELKPEKYFKGPRLLLRELISRQFQLQAVKVSKDFVTNKSMQSILQLPDGPDLNYLLGLINAVLCHGISLIARRLLNEMIFPRLSSRKQEHFPSFPSTSLTTPTVRGTTAWSRSSRRCSNCTSACTPRRPTPSANASSARSTPPTNRLTRWCMNCTG